MLTDVSIYDLYPIRSRHCSIALIGLSGVGKSSAARLVAAKLGWFWVDIDELIVQRASCSIAEIFGDEGEDYFRSLEARTLEEVLHSPDQPCVISTGGGIVLNEENRDRLRAQTYIVWLDAATSVLIQRLQLHSEKRSLPGQATEARIETVRQTLVPLYRALCDAMIDTSSLEPLQIAEKVLLLYKHYTTAGESA